MLQAVDSINGGILWANLNLLFWLSLLPFSTGWVGENHFACWPMVLYGSNLLLCAVAYYLLQTCLIHHLGEDSLLAKAVSGDKKGKISQLLYVVGIIASWTASPLIGLACFIAVALIWLIPDRRVERALAENPDSGKS